MAFVTCAFTVAATALRASSLGGQETWGTVANCLARDDARAGYSTNLSIPYPDGFTFFLVASAPASAVPSGATITGMTFEIDRKGDTPVGSWKDSLVTFWTGAATGDNLASAVEYTATDATVTYGSSGAVGFAVTPAIRNAASFGVAISCVAASLDMEDGLPEIDFIGNLTTYYTEAPSDPTYDQDSYRFRNDDGSESAATWKAAVNTDVSIVAGVPFRLRYLIQNSGAGENFIPQWEYRIDQGAGYGDWTTIGTSPAPVQESLSAYFNNGADCTQQIGAGTFVTDNNGMYESDPITLTTTTSGEWEAEACLVANPDLVQGGETVQVRYTEAGNALATYTRTATFTVTAVPGATVPSPDVFKFDKLLRGRLRRRLW